MKKLILETSLSQLKSGVSLHSESKTIIYKDPKTGAIKACANKCKHGAGHFLGDHDCILKCQFHGWQLDASTMEYVNPSGGLKQTQYECEVNGDKVSIFSLESSIFSSSVNENRLPLERQEFTLTFYAHASMEFAMGDKYIVSDPWLEGPAFTRGWWLKHTVHPDVFRRVANASYIYVSHNHSDHLNIPSLERIYSINPNVAFLVPDFETGSVEKMLKRMGFKNLHVCKFNEWVQIGDYGRAMIIPDTTGRDDSGLLVEYKGRKVLNTVDCAKLNDFDLPSDIEVLLHPFAGGASGFPVCWGDLYSAEKISTIVERNRQLIKVEADKVVQLTNPKLFIPFAGYFSELHPADKEIKEINIKNSPEEFCQYLSRKHLDLNFWIPESGETLDIYDYSRLQKFPKVSQGNYDFDKYIDEIKEVMKDSTWSKLSTVEDYLRQVNFSDNLVLHIVETGDNFSDVVREFFFDFKEQKIIPGRPDRQHQYSRFKVRSSVFRYVLKNNLPWEDFSIGFQARFYREPDVYEFAFWNHFQNLLEK